MNQPPLSSRSILARGTLSRSGITVPIMLRCNISTLGGEPVSCSAVLDQQTWPKAFGLFYTRQGPFEVIASSDEGKNIWIPDFAISKLMSAMGQGRDLAP